MRKGYEAEECYTCDRIMDDMREHIGGAWYCKYCAEYQKTVGDLSMQIQRVRELHKPTTFPASTRVLCQECGYYDYYPCATIKALDEEEIDPDRLIAIKQQQDSDRG